MTDNSTSEEDVYDMEYEMEYLIAEINVILVSVVLLINLFHFFILTRKELRGLSVFIVMISVCISDILYLISKLLYYGNTVRIYRRTDYCYLYDSLLITKFLGCANFTAAGSEITSIWLVVLMAFYRSLSVTFPLKQVVKQITSVKATIGAMAIVLVLGYSWQGWQYLFVFTIYKRKIANPCDYIKDINATEPDQYSLMYLKAQTALVELTGDIETVFIVVELILYALFAILLIISLRKTKRNQKKTRNAKEEKKDNTTKLVLGMTIVFLVTQMFHPLLIFVYALIPGEGFESSVSLTHIFIAIKNALQIFHSGSHGIISFFMSTQYRETVRRVFGVKKKMKKVVTVTVSLTASSS